MGARSHCWVSMVPQRGRPTPQTFRHQSPHNPKTNKSAQGGRASQESKREERERKTEQNPPTGLQPPYGWLGAEGSGSGTQPGGDGEPSLTTPGPTAAKMARERDATRGRR